MGDVERAGLFARAGLGLRPDAERRVDIGADYLSGAVMPLRRNATDTVAGFDPTIFCYYETSAKRLLKAP